MSDLAMIASLAQGGDLSMKSILAAHPMLQQALAASDQLNAASTLGGLLTVPDLQCNCCRLEALVHAAVAFSDGTKKIKKSQVATWFNDMSSGPCGLAEDPAEDALTSAVATPRGSFRILEGIWESAGFYLQRFVNIVEDMPSTGDWSSLRDSFYALLYLSDEVCKRASLGRFEFGNTSPKDRIPNVILSQLNDVRKRVTFSKPELDDLGVSYEHLMPFVLPQEFRSQIPSTSITHSPLAHHPLLRRNDRIVVALPTAISVALRTMVIGSMSNAGLKDLFIEELGHEYGRLFRSHPVLGTGFNAPIHFRATENGVMACFAKEIDTGRFLNFIFVLDTLDGFDEGGFASRNPDPLALVSDLDRWTEECRESVKAQPPFTEGMTLVVPCGIGRGTAYVLSEKEFGDWAVESINAAELATLSFLSDVKPLTLWRITNAERRLSEQGVSILNTNGFSNLIAWVRSLGGNLVDHSQIPEQFGTGNKCTLLLDASMIRDLRAEVARDVDPHSIACPDGRWVNIRKTADSLFDEERNLPLYVSEEVDPDCGIPFVFLTKDRTWWCRVMYPHNYQRWKVLQTWLPKVADVAERMISGLPSGSLTVEIKFAAFDEALQECKETTLEEIQTETTVDVEQLASKVVVETGQSFENGFADPENISEAALVASIVKGLLLLTGCTPKIDEIAAICAQIVPDHYARSCHAFTARRFRDFVRNTLPKAPITVNSIDDATVRLGLGWRVRDRKDGFNIEGKDACTGFLNQLVTVLEGELCESLGTFNRQALVNLAIENHEAAMAYQSTWRRTVAANLSLHEDKHDTLSTIGEQEFENNAALQASRVVAEIAVCECPVDTGLTPGKLDMSRIMAIACWISELGGWSDAIHRDAMEPAVKISPLGDVSVNDQFLVDVVKPFGEAVHEDTVEASVSNYERNFKAATPTGAVEPSLEAKFTDAWKEEFGCSIDDLRLAADTFEDFGIEQSRALLSMTKEESISLLGDNGVDGQLIVDLLTTRPRPCWREVPDGIEEKDCDIWRFRRRLSLLRLPIVQLEESDNPSLLIAPGLLRDSINYCIHNHYEGSFSQEQIKTQSMRSWRGHAVNTRGWKFADDVAMRLGELGWQAEKEVLVTKIVRKTFQKNYGDVDVLAWDLKQSRVLLIECKDLNFHKTTGELAEQLSDFRGIMRNGKPDLLMKHLERCDILREHKADVAKYVKLPDALTIENWIVFRHPVPMLFAWKQHSHKIGIAIYSELKTL
ncbi:MAG: hypothetical protein AAGD11_07590 [Planctomycetota bacterium]